MRLPFRITFACDARADLVDEEMLALMKRAGAWMISYGIETANPELLKLLDKSLSLARAERAVRLTREAGIIAKGLFMIGVPGETVQTIERTKAFIDRLPFDLINVSKFTPYPGSDIHRTISQYGSFQEDWKQMSAMNFVFWPNTVDREVLKREGMAIPAEFYGKPRRIKNIFRRTMNRRDAVRIAYLIFLKATGRLRGVFAVDGGARAVTGGIGIVPCPFWPLRATRSGDFCRGRAVAGCPVFRFYAVRNKMIITGTLWSEL